MVVMCASRRILGLDCLIHSIRKQTHRDSISRSTPGAPGVVFKSAQRSRRTAPVYAGRSPRCALHSSLSLGGQSRRSFSSKWTKTLRGERVTRGMSSTATAAASDGKNNRESGVLLQYVVLRRDLWQQKEENGE